jgi:Zn-dependent protease
MNPQHVFDIVFEAIAFLFAISVHESSHAWMANLRGDPTARMLGRISLNPIRHIDPIGTLLLPAVAMFFHLPVIGWAKPTPVDPRNFRNPVLDDILTAVIGPISNFVVASGALLVLGFVKTVSPTARQVVFGIPEGLAQADANSLLVPLCQLFYWLMVINIVLGVFNLIPVPPLDGSHVLRHFLPSNMLRMYDTLGIIGLFLLVFWGGGLLGKLIYPAIGLFQYILFKI